jgi:pimeloyl-ACP methyl ester carboxylesterase
MSAYRTIDVDGSEVFYREAGDAAARTRRPPALLPWGRNDTFFPPAGAEAYLADLPDAQVHLLDTGHFATATHSDQIAELISAFVATPVAA